MIASHEQTPRVESAHTQTSGYPQQDGYTIPSLLKELRDNILHLFRQEIALAREETSENLRRVSKQGIAMAIGGAVAFLGAIILLMGVASATAVLLREMGLAAEHAVWVGPLVVGLVVAVIGFAMLMGAKNRLKNTNLVPKRSVETLKEDSHWAKEKLQRS